MFCCGCCLLGQLTPDSLSGSFSLFEFFFFFSCLVGLFADFKIGSVVRSVVLAPLLSSLLLTSFFFFLSFFLFSFFLFSFFLFSFFPFFVVRFFSHFFHFIFSCFLFYFFFPCFRSFFVFVFCLAYVLCDFFLSTGFLHFVFAFFRLVLELPCTWYCFHVMCRAGWVGGCGFRYCSKSFGVNQRAGLARRRGAGRSDVFWFVPRREGDPCSDWCHFVELTPYAPGRLAVAAGVAFLKETTKRSTGLGSLSDVVAVVQTPLVCAS